MNVLPGLTGRGEGPEGSGHRECQEGSGHQAGGDLPGAQPAHLGRLAQAASPGRRWPGTRCAARPRSGPGPQRQHHAMTASAWPSPARPTAPASRQRCAWLPSFPSRSPIRPWRAGGGPKPRRPKSSAGQGSEVGTVRVGAARGPDTGADESQEGETPGQEGAWSLTLALVTAFIYDCSHGQQMIGFESWQS